MPTQAPIQSMPATDTRTMSLSCIARCAPTPSLVRLSGLAGRFGWYAVRPVRGAAALWMRPSFFGSISRGKGN